MNTTTQTQEGAERQAPSIRYRGVVQPTVDSEGSASTGPDNRPAALRWLNGGIHVFVMAVWAVVGLVVWVPLLLREMVRFSLALVPATLQGRSPREESERLGAAIDFYRRGFAHASAGVRGDQGDADQGSSAAPISSRSLTREFLWVGLIWYALLALFGVLWSPVEIGQWIGALPWGEWSTSFGAWLVEPFS